MFELSIASRFGGIFRSIGPVARRAHDAAVEIAAGMVAHPVLGELPAGGAGWDAESALGACVGEAVERLAARPLARDRAVVASFDRFPIDEPAIDPARFVLFSREQYDVPGFPFLPLDRAREVRWSCFRDVASGEPRWIPEELGFLFARGRAGHAIAPGISTGLSCGRARDPVVLRGAQEAIERDALVGAWWGAYRAVDHDPARVLAMLGERAARVVRPNLAWRFFRVATPFAAHATISVLEGEDEDALVISTGSACRETRRESFEKSILEAVQGRSFVRALVRGGAPGASPRTFAEHAVWPSFDPERFARSPLGVRRSAPTSDDDGGGERTEAIEALAERLGPERPILARVMTPPAFASERLGLRVVKVVVPGLQPLHGDHALAHLGGAMGRSRSLDSHLRSTPHPFA